ncbi:MAG: hypothetical protein ABIO81_07185 [Ginsengibacter sp.]
MKITPIFLLLLALLIFSQTHLLAQVRKDSVYKKPAIDYRILKTQVSGQSQKDTTPRPPSPRQKEPTQRDESQNNRRPEKYIIPDTTRPVPVETHTYIRSVLRLKKIYVNDDARELIELLNPGITNTNTVMSNYQLILPEFPEPDSRSNRSVNREFKDDLEPDENVNNLFAVAARQLDTLANIFYSKDFDLEDTEDKKNYTIVKNLLPALADLTRQATSRIKRISKKTVSTLTTETNALNKLLSEYNITSTLSRENIDRVYSLMADMNILLYGITGKKLKISQEGLNTYLNNRTFNYSLVSYNLSLNTINEYENSSDDDPRKFNIYIYRRGLVENNGKRDPEMKVYTISYAIPALAGDIDEWTKLPERASTVHCYFAPARFKFTITDNRTGQVYDATEDLYDAQRDPDEKWTIIDLFDRHPTYRLIFLLP